MSRAEIEAEAKRRNIEFLCHFTRIENVPDIVREGLVSRQQLSHMGRNGRFNDSERLDYQEGAICCSVSFPNYKVFWPFRCNIYCAGWVVVILKPEVLWQKECAFSVENAASGGVTSIPIQDRIGIHAFNSMFGDWPGKQSREVMRLSDEYPTNPQAEVLVGEPIEPEYILAFVTETDAHANEIKSSFNGVDALCEPWFFKPRDDWEFWS